MTLNCSTCCLYYLVRGRHEITGIIDRIPQCNACVHLTILWYVAVAQLDCQAIMVIVVVLRYEIHFNCSTSFLYQYNGYSNNALYYCCTKLWRAVALSIRLDFQLLHISIMQGRFHKQNIQVK